MVEALRPKTLEEALALRKQHTLIPFAGGTDLMVRRRQWSGLPPRFEAPPLFIGGLEELRQIGRKDGFLTIGSAATLAALMEHGAVPGILKEAAAGMASPAIRNVGTIGGNICNASPAGDTLPVLYVLDAAVVLKSSAGCREMPIEDFIKGPGRTELQEDELLVEIKLPPEAFNRSYYKKVGTRKADALSKLSFAAAARTENGVLKAVGIAFGAVGPTVVRVKAAEARLKGRKLDEIQELAADMAKAYGEYIRPIDDQRSNAAYRKTVSLNLLERFLKEFLVG